MSADRRLQASHAVVSSKCLAGRAVLRASPGQPAFPTMLMLGTDVACSFAGGWDWKATSGHAGPLAKAFHFPPDGASQTGQS
jgi:hypothetical protein